LLLGNAGSGWAGIGVALFHELLASLVLSHGSSAGVSIIYT
jgi:hypothetical protein